MKRLVTITVLAALAAVDVARGQNQTNLVQTLTFKLKTWSQGATVTNGSTVTNSVVQGTIENSNIIAWLGASVGISFATNAQLVLVTPLGVPSPSVSIMVQQKVGKEISSVDVTSFFNRSQDPLIIDGTSENTANGQMNGEYFGNWSNTLQDSPYYPPLTAHFTVSGFVTATVSPLLAKKGALVTNVTEGTSPGSAGKGDENGAPILVRGNVTISGRALQVVAPPLGV